MTARQMLRTILPMFLLLLMASCSGPDHKDPQSVADAALRCYATEDVKGMKRLLDPANKQKQEGFEKFITMLEAMKEKGVKASSKDDRPAFEDYTVKWMKDPFGYPLNENTKELNVRYRYNRPRLRLETFLYKF